MNTEPLRYPALMDGEEGANGVVFPDLPGCVAMGYTVEDAIVNAEDAIRDYTLDAEQDGEVLPEPSPFQSIEVPEGLSTRLHSSHSSLRTTRKGNPDP